MKTAQAAQSKADFIHKYNISLKEARETNYWLRLLVAAEVIPKDKITDLLRESREIAKIIAQIIINTKNNG